MDLQERDGTHPAENMPRRIGDGVAAVAWSSPEMPGIEGSGCRMEGDGLRNPGATPKLEGSEAYYNSLMVTLVEGTGRIDA